MAAGDKALVVAGAGTAGLAYLSTVQLDPQYTHVLLLGSQGYWSQVSHRLAQPPHILALPHQESGAFVDPAEHDRLKGIPPEDDRSAYEHTDHFQARLSRLEELTVKGLQDLGKQVCCIRDVDATRITKSGMKYQFNVGNSQTSFHADKLVMASGAPARGLPDTLLKNGAPSPQERSHLMNYDDIFIKNATEKIRGKDMFIYGGGATAGWVMEIVKELGGSAAWVAQNGFRAAQQAGPRVESIVNSTVGLQTTGKVDSIEFLDAGAPGSEEKRVKITVIEKDDKGAESPRVYFADYVVNCTGQDPYAPGGLHDVLAPDIKDQLVPVRDSNQFSGNAETILGFASPERNLEIIGAAAASYRDDARRLRAGLGASQSLPGGAKAPATIGGVVASVSALTGYMPLSQDPDTGKVRINALNLNVMNATQVATYITAEHPDATADKVNAAVEAFLERRSKTWFGLSNLEIEQFLAHHFE